MIICSRKEAQELIGVESNLFKEDERNKDIVSEYIDYETKELRHGKFKGQENLKEEQRKEIATLALTSGLTNEEVAKFIGVHPQTVSSSRNGEVADGSRKDEVLNEHVKEVKGEIVERAQNKIMEAIEALTGEKVRGAKARDIAGIAKDMSQIVRNMNPDGGSGINIQQKVMIYQPRVKEESDFQIIAVNE